MKLDHFRVTARGTDNSLRVLNISMRQDDQRSVNEVAELRFTEHFQRGDWTVVHVYWFNAPEGLRQTRKWDGH